MARELSDSDQAYAREFAKMANAMRVKRGHTLTQAAARAGISNNDLQKIVHNGTCSAIMAMRFAEAMDCNLIFTKRRKVRSLDDIDGAWERDYLLRKQNARKQQNVKKRAKQSQWDHDRKEYERQYGKKRPL